MPILCYHSRIMNQTKLAIAVGIVGILLPVTLLAASWPASTSGTDIGVALLAADSGFEPSGIVYHPGRGTLIAVSDEGQVAEIETDGTLVSEWKLGSAYDLEDVTVADDASSIVYLGDENTSDALGFDLSTGALTGDAWDFSSKMSETSGAGMESLTWIPDGHHAYGTTASGGVFYSGWQYDGAVYVFEPNLSSSGTQTYLGKISSAKGYTNASGATYGPMTGIAFVLYGGSALEELDETGSLSAYYSLPGSDQEGVAIIEDCAAGTASVIFAEDSAKRIMSYAGYPISCIDADGDGADITADCDDTDATVSTDQTYYVDADRDGYGSDVSISECVSTAPFGYVSNSDDLYDNARVEISGDGKDNDGDAYVDEVNTLAENGPHPLYRTYSATTSGYIASSAVVPATGWVRITYIDGAVYDYMLFPVRAIYPLTSVAGTSYYTARSGWWSATLNGLNGNVTLTRTVPTVSGAATAVKTRF